MYIFNIAQKIVNHLHIKSQTWSRILYSNANCRSLAVLLRLMQPTVECFIQALPKQVCCSSLLATSDNIFAFPKQSARTPTKPERSSFQVLQIKKLWATALSDELSKKNCSMSSEGRGYACTTIQSRKFKVTKRTVQSNQTK